jgi:hypothetical protein
MSAPRTQTLSHYASPTPTPRDNVEHSGIDRFWRRKRAPTT